MWTILGQWSSLNSIIGLSVRLMMRLSISPTYLTSIISVLLQALGILPTRESEPRGSPVRDTEEDAKPVQNNGIDIGDDGDPELQELEVRYGFAGATPIQ